MASFWTLLLAVILASPALWHAFVAHDMDPTTAGIRFLIAVPVAGIMIAVLRGLARTYQANARTSGQPIRVTSVTGEPLPKSTHRLRASDDEQNAA